MEKFGKDTLDIIEDTPDKLLTVQGIGKVRVDRIKTSWQEQKEIKNIMLFLQSHEVSTSHATKIFKTYGSESITIVKENPYRLADDIWGIGFKTADSIAQKMGIDKGKFVRLRSGIFYTLNKLAEAGHCYATREQLIGKARELLSYLFPMHCRFLYHCTFSAEMCKFLPLFVIIYPILDSDNFSFLLSSSSF